MSDEDKKCYQMLEDINMTTWSLRHSDDDVKQRRGFAKFPASLHNIYIYFGPGFLPFERDCKYNYHNF